MKIESLANPATPTLPTGKAEITGGQTSPRERAIAKLMGTQNNTAQTHPVRDPSNVSPEEMTAIRAPSTENSRQLNTNEGDASPDVPKEEPKAAEEAPLSSQYAILARKEKMLRQREQALKAKETALRDAKPASTEAPKPSFDESKYVDKTRLTQDPFKVLNELGLTYDQLTELALNAPKPEQLAIMNQVSKLEAKIAELESKNESNRKSFEDQQVDQRTQAIKQIEYSVNAAVKNNVDFETIKEMGKTKDVVKLIERTFDEGMGDPYSDDYIPAGTLLSAEEAAHIVEEYLVEEALRFTKLNKIQQKLALKPQAEVSKATDQNKQQPIKTLTNSVSSSRKLSNRERAMLAFEGKLKS